MTFILMPWIETYGLFYILQVKSIKCKTASKDTEPVIVTTTVVVLTTIIVLWGKFFSHYYLH